MVSRRHIYRHKYSECNTNRHDHLYRYRNDRLLHRNCRCDGNRNAIANSNS